MFVFAIGSHARVSVVKLEPSSWYVDLKNDTVLVLAYGKDLTLAQITTNYPEVSVGKVTPTMSSGFIAFELVISPTAKAGKMRIDFWEMGKVAATMGFDLLDLPIRQQSPLTPADIIYQVLPDRFYNGNVLNDSPKELAEKADLLNPSGVHGGDIAGLGQKIPYLSKLGITAVELTPLFESDQLMGSYDKWSITDHYNIDRRLGTTDELVDFVNKSKVAGIKTIVTFVLNQMGRRHPLVVQQPFGKWMYPDQGRYGNVVFNATVLDPYASYVDRAGNVSIWPDIATVSLNLEEPLLQKYLVQHCLWWIATTGVDGIKIDQAHILGVSFVQHLTRLVSAEFPSVTVIADVETEDKPAQGHWLREVGAEGIRNCDYALAGALENAFSDFQNPTDGLKMIYESLSKDYCLPNIYANVVFADNHRMNRAFSNADKDIQQMKMLLATVFAMRGIPQITYGTETLTEGLATDGYGFVRKDFPGIKDSDVPNGFTGKGLSAQQNHVAGYLKQLIDWRKNCPAAQWGKLVHYVPEDGLYLFFRHTEKQHVMVVVNNNPQEKKKLSPLRYSLDIGNANRAVDMLTKQVYDAIDNIIVLPKSVLILELVYLDAESGNGNLP
ncbi:MAG: alpha-amylase family glycosyl hydrolase [Breznakibacter sp.]